MQRARIAPERWSAVEYGCHVRDVLGNLRDRIILALVEDDPIPHPMHGTPRVDLGLYARDVPEVTARDLVSAGDLFARTLDCLPEGAGRRTLFYGWPRAATRSIDWVAAQALHECRHHLDDVRVDLVGGRRVARADGLAVDGALVPRYWIDGRCSCPPTRYRPGVPVSR